MIIDSIETRNTPNVTLRCSSDIVSILKSFYGEIKKASEQEIFVVASLNGSHELTALNIVSVGTVNRCLVHPREVYKFAIQNNSSAVIVAHNHPSGKSDPSEEDIDVTRMIYAAGTILGIQVLDHVIIGRDTYYSFLENDYFKNLDKVLKNTAFYKDFIKA